MSVKHKIKDNSRGEVVQVELQVGAQQARAQMCRERRKMSLSTPTSPKNKDRDDAERPGNDSSDKTYILLLKLTPPVFLPAK